MKRMSILFVVTTLIYCNDAPKARVLRLLFMLATEHTLLRMFLNIWCQILFPEDLHDAAFWNFCTFECGKAFCLF